MADDKQLKIDIPESIDAYKVTLFWGMTVKQIVLVFIATLFVGFGIFAVVSKNYLAALGMFTMTTLCLLGIAEIKGRNFYRYLYFIFSYYKSKPRVLIYNHYSASGTATVQSKQLVYQEENNTKLFVLIFSFIGFGLLILSLIGVYLYHVLR